MTKLDTLLKASPLVERASKLAKTIHQGQRRKNGDPYYYHLLAVAQTVSEWELDEHAIAAAFLHSVLDTQKITAVEIEQEFNAEIAQLVTGVAHIKKFSYQGLQKDLETFRKFVLQIGQDLRAMLIQLAERLDNLKVLYVQEPDMQKRIALETLEVYAPLAYQLGMYKLGGELEDLAFPYLYPKEYKWILKNLKDLYETRERYVEKLKGLVEASLKAHGLTPVHVHSRAKRYASLYKKLLRHDMDINQIYDLVALRVVVNTVEECYQALEIINKYWPPFPEGFDDYIENPKPNGYRSLHANIYGPGKRITEVQIRTKEMHHDAEIGVAARFAYERHKELPAYTLKKGTPAVANSSWIRRLLLWRSDPKQNSKVSLFSHTLLVISPKQELIELPVGATALDYAYKIHTNLGSHAQEAKINSEIKPLSTPLAFGDIVEIVEDPAVKPSSDWLTAVVTSTAKQHIRAALEKQGVIGVRLSDQKPVGQSAIHIYHSGQTGILQAVRDLLRKQGVAIEKTTVHTTGLISRSPTISLITARIDRSKNRELAEKLGCIAGVSKAVIR